MLATAQEKKFNIRGEIAKLEAPAKVYLMYRSGDSFFRDSILPEKGKFNFNGNIEEAVLGTVFINEHGTGMDDIPADHRFNFYLEPGVITIKSLDSVKDIKISGTPLNMDLNNLRLALKPVSDKKAAADEADRKALQQQRNDILEQFIKTHPGSLVSFDALKEYAGIMPDPERVIPVYDYLSDALKAKKAVAAYYQLLQDIKKTAVGQMAPDFTEADTSGNNVSLHDFKGKYVLLDFWASWCKPCRHENPAVVSAFNQYKDKDFTIISVSLDAPGAKAKWIKAIHDDGLTGWTHLSDLNFWGNVVARLYAIQSIPQNFLLDKEGKIIAKNLRGKDLEIKLHEILGNSN
ncbi:Peroxiredoxin [Chitinophaga sp. CF118]|nr:Peroxiredoxin [Chitinophaga sp. CF118]